MQIPEIPFWTTPLATIFASVFSGVVAGVVAYRNQSRQLKIDWEKAQADMKKAGTEEFEAINAGNRTLRESLIDQIKTVQHENDHLHEENDNFSRQIASLRRQLRDLESTKHDENTSNRR